jgi:hypothetical protein
MGVRPVTDGELAHYVEHGWAKLDRLVDPAVAAEMLAVAKRKVEHAETTQGIWNTLFRLANEHVEPFRSVAFSPVSARNAERLSNRRRLTDRKVGIRFVEDLIAVKLQDARDTHFHHDGHGFAGDRAGSLTFWLALDDVTPEMGAMRFLSGSHREGPLGLVDGETSLTELYPKLLERYEWSPPLSYRPGDATVHHAWLVHGAPPNTTESPRWSYLFGYVPADVQIHGAELRRLTNENSVDVAVAS